MRRSGGAVSEPVYQRSGLVALEVCGNVVPIWGIGPAVTGPHACQLDCTKNDLIRSFLFTTSLRANLLKTGHVGVLRVCIACSYFLICILLFLFHIWHA